MHISRIHVKNFRSLLDEDIPCESLTALVGKNGSGKSSFLAALEHFYDRDARLIEEDFYDRDTSDPIEITVTFSDLAPGAAEAFASYIRAGVLKITKVLPPGTVGTYYGVRLQYPGFDVVRQAGGKRESNAAYRELRKDDEWTLLPPASSADVVESALAAWEAEHADECVPSRDAGGFFGFDTNVSGDLAPYTAFLRIPAVRDATEDAIEGRGTSITQLMDIVVRRVLDSREDVAKFRTQTQAQYEEVLYPTLMPELEGLEATLSSTLSDFAPTSELVLRWSDPPQVIIPPPQAEVRVAEDGYEASIQRTGHGLQRAFIFTMLQHLSAAAEESRADHAEGESSSDGPTLVLGIDEPELYQHPSRQRHLAAILRRLATGDAQGVAAHTQVLYTTHSPLFISLDWFDQIRVLRKVPRGTPGPKITRAHTADMDAIAEEIWEATEKAGEKFTSETLRPRLASVMTPWMNEGFFADVVVLVEGEDDRAAVLGAAKAEGADFDSMGIAVIPCSGITNIDRPLVIFRHLGIPVYVVWDGDKGKDGNTRRKDSRSQTNRYLCRLLGRTEEDWPHFFEKHSACFEVDLETTLKAEIGENFESYRSEAQVELGLESQSLKNPKLVERILESAAKDGISSSSLGTIVNGVVALQREARGT